MPRFTQGRLAATLLAATMGVWSSAAMAQTQSGARAPSAEQAQNTVQQVIVTAERRSEALQKVPLEVQAFNAKQLQSAGVVRVEDLSRVTPGLTFSNEIGGAMVFLRGVGTPSQENPGEEGGVAVYVDDIYYADNDGAMASLANAQNVEVLKGPQGTLYGRNATGGLIHIIYPDPKDTPHAVVRIGYESYNTVTGSFYGTGPIIADKLDGSIAFDTHYQFDGFGKNTTLNERINYQRYTSVMAKLLWNPTGQDRVTFEGSYYNDPSDLGTVVGLFPGTRNQFGFRYDGNVFDQQSSVRSTHLTQAYGGSVKWEHDLGDGVVFKSVTAYRDVMNEIQNLNEEADPTDFENIGVHKSGWSFQQEFLLQGTTKRLDWTAGLFYFTDGEKELANLYIFPLGMVGGRPTGPFGQTVFIDSHTTLISYSAFGQVDWHLTDSDTLTGGLRYTVDRQGLQGKEILSGAAVGEIALNQHKPFGRPTWRAAYKHQFSNDLMAYVSYSRGFRSGAFNFDAVTDPPVRPEILDAYEGGLKATLAGGRLQVGVNGYYYDYSNMQVLSAENAGNGIAVQLRLQNAGKAQIYGVEFNGTAAIPVAVGDLQVRLDTGLMQDKFTSFLGCEIWQPSTTAPPGVNATGTCTGNQLPYAPQWTLSIGPDYRVPLTNLGGMLELNASYYHSSGFFFAADNVFKQRAYDTFNAEIDYTFPNNRLRLRLYGRNLSNAVVENYVIPSDGISVAATAPSPPRVFGGEIDYTFN